MIITKLNGGLGNQMWQYAFGRAMQLKYNDELYIDIEEFRRTYGHEPRHFSLSDLSLPSDVNVLPIEKSSTLLPFKFLQKINREMTTRIARLFNVYWWRKVPYVDLKIKNTKGKKCYFYGYWQSVRYFDFCEDIIKKELKVKTPVRAENQHYEDDIQNSNSVCVHIRRGDFVTEGMIVCDESYYLRGEKYISEHTENPKFFIFTNDKKWVQENIPFTHDVVFVDVDDPDYEVLRLMYSCKHFVISNSSFSWWAQYLSENKDKIVVAPSVWHLSRPEDKTVYQDNWTIL